MSQDQFCSDCTFRTDCKKIYQQIGHSKGPSIATKAALAFLLPIVVFIAALVLCEKNLAIENKSIKIAVSFLSACIASFGCIIITKKIAGIFKKNS